MKTEADSHCCGKCKMTLTTLADFLIHKLQHIGHGKGMGCELCGLGYNRVAPLQNHYKSKHGMEIFAKRHFVKIPKPPSKETHVEPSPSTILSSSVSTTTSSPALKHLLSTPFVGSSSATSLTSFIDNTVYEAKLPSASRNLQSAKDKLIATSEFGLLTRQKKMTPAESNIELCSTQTQLVQGEENCSSSGIDLGSPETHLTSADPDLSADAPLSSADDLPSVDIHMSSAHAHMPSAHQHISSAHAQVPNTEHAGTSLICSEGNLSDVEATDLVTSDVEGTDLVTSDVMFSSHPIDMSSTSTHLTSDVSGLDPTHLPPSNLNDIEKPLLDSSDKIPPSKTLHVVITKADGDGIHMEDGDCCSLSHNTLETVESEQDSERGPTHLVGDVRSEHVQNEKHEQTDITKEASKHQNGQTFKPDFHFILLANPVKGRVLSYHRNQFKCFHCDYKTSWINSLIKHMKTYHEDMMSIHENIEIKSMHNGPNRKLVKMSTYSAEMRSLKNSSRNKRGRGVEKQDRPGEFRCKTCDKIFNRLRYLRKHMQVHRTEKKHLCDECGKSFKTRPYLLSHYRVHKIKEYRCSQCDFRSSINAVIHAHRQLHHEDSVLCDICGFAYNDKSTLKKHKLVHDPSRPHACSFPGCTWRFNSKVMCLAHVRAHTSEGKFQCSLCSYVFRQNHHLQRHTAKVHGIHKPPKKVIHKKSEQTEDQEDDPNSVRLILDYSQMEVDNFSSVLQNGQLVIATDSEGNTINYQVADITMNVSLLEQAVENSSTDGQTVLVPNSDCEQIIFHESEMP